MTTLPPLRAVRSVLRQSEKECSQGEERHESELEVGNDLSSHGDVLPSAADGPTRPNAGLHTSARCGGRSRHAPQAGTEVATAADLNPVEFQPGSHETEFLHHFCCHF